MSGIAMRKVLIGAVLAGVPLLLSGCTYDYLQHTDRVAYSAGDAVQANLEAQTINPSKPSMYSKTGLGKNGTVIPSATGSATPTKPATTPGG